MTGELPADFAAHARRVSSRKLQAEGRNDRHAQGLAERARGVRAAAAGTARRLGRSGRLEPDDLERLARTSTRRRGRGNYIYYGVREFGMSAIMNGIALHGGFIPYGGTFLMFSDYARNARAHVGADEGARDLMSTRTIRSAWAKTARRTSRSSISPACA